MDNNNGPISKTYLKLSRNKNKELQVQCQQLETENQRLTEKVAELTKQLASRTLGYLFLCLFSIQTIAFIWFLYFGGK